MKTLTVDSVMRLGPCYTRERVAELFGKRERVSVAMALDADIPIWDRIWLGIRCMPARQQRLFACACAERALGRERAAGREPDARSWEVVRVARRYAYGKATGNEMAAAGDAAMAAAMAAAWDAAGAAAGAAAGDAARAAARHAAWDAERKWQLAWIKERVR